MKKHFPDKLIKQVRYLLLNRELSYADIERILCHKISWTSISNIKKGRYNTDVEGFEPPDNYEEYLRVYVKI